MEQSGNTTEVIERYSENLIILFQNKYLQY